MIPDLYKLRNLLKIQLALMKSNSIGNKIELLKDLKQSNIDILMVAEKEIDETFPEPHFLVDMRNFQSGYSNNHIATIKIIFSLLDIHGFEDLIKQSVCLKNAWNSSCINYHKSYLNRTYLKQVSQTFPKC